MYKRLTLTLAALVLLTACSQSKLDTVIAAFDAASALPAALNLPANEQTCAAELFRTEDVALKSFKQTPNAQTWQLVSNAASQLNAGQCIRNPRLVAFVTVAQKILASVQPNANARSSGVPDFNQVSDADVKELKRRSRL
jgi:hypothetical protein